MTCLWFCLFCFVLLKCFVCLGCSTYLDTIPPKTKIGLWLLFYGFVILVWPCWNARRAFEHCSVWKMWGTVDMWAALDCVNSQIIKENCILPILQCPFWWWWKISLVENLFRRTIPFSRLLRRTFNQETAKRKSDQELQTWNKHQKPETNLKARTFRPKDERNHKQQTNTTQPPSESFCTLK